MLELILVVLAQVPFTTRVSVDDAGLQGMQSSGNPVITPDGRYVAFQSDAAFVPADTNGMTDVYVHDRLLGTTELVSWTYLNTISTGRALEPCISADGQRIAFYSAATDLVPNPDANGSFDVFLRDRTLGTTELISVSLTGAAGDQYSFFPDISGDGRYIVYESRATDLVTGDTLGVSDVFRRDLLTNTTDRVSVGPGGVEANNYSSRPAISADGHSVAFESQATNLGPPDTGPTRDIYVRNYAMGSMVMASLKSTGGQSIFGSANPDISGDGTVVVFEGNGLVPNDTNGATDVHLRDFVLGKTTRVSTSSIGTEAHGYSVTPSISDNGRFVAFKCSAKDILFPKAPTQPYTQIYVKDRKYGSTGLISANPTGDYGAHISETPAISADGQWVAFGSYASDLVPGDSNDVRDIFVHEQLIGGPRLNVYQVGTGFLATLEIGDATPGGPVLVGFSLGDQGPLATPLGLISLGSSFGTLLLVADGQGETQLTASVVLHGHPLFVQAVDLTSGRVSNSFALQQQ